MSENIWHFSFPDWLNLINMNVYSYIYSPPNDITSFLFMVENKFHHVYIPHFLYLSLVSRHLAWLHGFIIVNNTFMNMMWKCLHNIAFLLSLPLLCLHTLLLSYLFFIKNSYNAFWSYFPTPIPHKYSLPTQPHSLSSSTPFFSLSCLCVCDHTYKYTQRERKINVYICLKKIAHISSDDMIIRIWYFNNKGIKVTTINLKMYFQGLFIMAINQNQNDATIF